VGRETQNRTTLVDEDVRSYSTLPPGRERPVLVRVLAPRVGLTFDAYPIGDVLVIGRNPPGPADAQIDDHKASRRHAEVKWLDELGGHALCDLRSTNGTFLNGAPVDRESLAPGDVVRTGNSLFVYCPAPPTAEGDARGLVVGRSRAIRETVRSLEQVAPTDLKVLLTGETGTGKELAARAIHDVSGRRGEFVAVNCGSFPATLIESELFGYVKGAFSGADRTKEGLIEAADRGTLFLDEIGEFPLDLQPRLLRVLQDHEVRPVGATASRRVDVRVVAATNRDVFGMVDTDRFRRDLLARLNEWPVALPPLRDRREDLGLLVTHFLRQRGAETQARAFDPDLFELMLLHRWEGNVRELGAAVARLAVTLLAGTRDPDVLRQVTFGAQPPALADERPVPPPPDAGELKRVMALFEGNISGVARYYGKERQQVYRWLDRFKLGPGAGTT
jgi:transcriptional regulator with GAF, ATPase, and Fis domain